MRNFTLLFVFALVVCVSASAQDYKWWAGGKTSLWNTDDHAEFVLAPEVGYHLSKKLTIAASVGYYSSFNYDNSSLNNNYVVLNPYLRFNAFLKGNVLFFVDGGVDCRTGKNDDAFQIGLKPGMAIFLTDRITAAFQFGFLGYNDGKGIGGVYKERVGFDLSGYQSGFAIFYSF